jgi:hypothetical protein
MLKIDGFDAALIGVSTVWQRTGEGAERIDTLIYNGDLIVTILMHESGLSEEEAMEYISYNIEGAYVGKNTPIRDGNKWNNSPRNLEVMTQSEHCRLHLMVRWGSKNAS